MKKQNEKKKASIHIAIVIALVFGMIFALFSFPVPIYNEGEIHVRQWIPVVLGDADPGGGNSGWLNKTVYYNETGDPANYYARNLTNNASSYAWTNTNNTHGGSDVPHSTALALWYEIRVNITDGYSSGNATWMPTWIRCNVTSAGLSLSDVGMDRYLIGSNSTYMWLAFVYQGGISITPGQNVTSCRFDVDMYK